MDFWHCSLPSAWVGFSHLFPEFRRWNSTWSAREATPIAPISSAPMHSFQFRKPFAQRINDRDCCGVRQPNLHCWKLGAVDFGGWVQVWWKNFVTIQAADRAERPPRTEPHAMSTIVNVVDQFRSVA